MKRKSLALIGVLFLVLSVSVFATGAAETEEAAFPDKPIELFVGFSAGGGTDVLSRKLAQVMEQELGQPVVVTNKPGSGGLVAIKEMAAADPDGYTLSVLLLNQFLQKYLDNSVDWIDPLEEVTLIGVFNRDAWGAAVRAEEPFESVNEFVDYAASEGDVKVGAGAPGTLYYWTWEALMDQTDAEMTIVPFRGTSLSLQALAGGEVTAAGAGAPEASSMMDAGLVKMLGVAAEERLPAFPNIPTFKEQGIDLVIGPWRSIVAPAGLPQDVQQTLADALEAAYFSPEFQEFLETQGFGGYYLNPEDGMEFYAEQDQFVRNLMERRGRLRADME